VHRESGLCVPQLQLQVGADVASRYKISLTRAATNSHCKFQFVETLPPPATRTEIGIGIASRRTAS